MSTTNGFSGSMASRGPNSAQKDPSLRRARPDSPESDSEDEGKAASFKSKRVKRRSGDVTASHTSLPNTEGIVQAEKQDVRRGDEPSLEHRDTAGSVDENAQSEQSAEAANTTPLKGPNPRASFLDQILAERSKKKKKKKKKQLG